MGAGPLKKMLEILDEDGTGVFLRSRLARLTPTIADSALRNAWHSVVESIKSPHVGQKELGKLLARIDAKTQAQLYDTLERRRREEIRKAGSRDWLRLAQNRKWKDELLERSNYLSERIEYSGTVRKITKAQRKKKRILVVTNRAVYFLRTQSFHCRRRIPLDKIASVTCSSVSPDRIIHVPSLYDSRFEESKSDEGFLDKLKVAYRRHMHIVLRVQMVSIEELHAMAMYKSSRRNSNFASLTSKTISRSKRRSSISYGRSVSGTSTTIHGVSRNSISQGNTPKLPPTSVLELKCMESAGIQSITGNSGRRKSVVTGGINHNPVLLNPDNLERLVEAENGPNSFRGVDAAYIVLEGAHVMACLCMIGRRNMSREEVWIPKEIIRRCMLVPRKSVKISLLHLTATPAIEVYPFDSIVPTYIADEQKQKRKRRTTSTRRKSVSGRRSSLTMRKPLKSPRSRDSLPVACGKRSRRESLSRRPGDSRRESIGPAAMIGLFSLGGSESSGTDLNTPRVTLVTTLEKELLPLFINTRKAKFVYRSVFVQCYRIRHWERWVRVTEILRRAFVPFDNDKFEPRSAEGAFQIGDPPTPRTPRNRNQTPKTPKRSQASTPRSAGSNRRSSLKSPKIPSSAAISPISLLLTPPKKDVTKDFGLPILDLKEINMPIRRIAYLTFGGKDPNYRLSVRGHAENRETVDGFAFKRRNELRFSPLAAWASDACHEKQFKHMRLFRLFLRKLFQDSKPCDLVEEYLGRVGASFLTEAEWTVPEFLFRVLATEVRVPDPEVFTPWEKGSWLPLEFYTFLWRQDAIVISLDDKPYADTDPKATVAAWKSWISRLCDSKSVKAMLILTTHRKSLTPNPFSSGPASLLPSASQTPNSLREVKTPASIPNPQLLPLTSGSLFNIKIEGNRVLQPPVPPSLTPSCSVMSSPFVSAASTPLSRTQRLILATSGGMPMEFISVNKGDWCDARAITPRDTNTGVLKSTSGGRSEGYTANEDTLEGFWEALERVTLKRQSPGLTRATSHPGV